MKLTALRWFTVPLMGLFLASHASAASLDDEAKQVVMDYFLRRNMMTLCGASLSFSTQEHQGLHRCDVCMSLQRGTLCRTAFSTCSDLITSAAWLDYNAAWDWDSVRMARPSGCH